MQGAQRLRGGGARALDAVADYRHVPPIAPIKGQFCLGEDEHIPVPAQAAIGHFEVANVDQVAHLADARLGGVLVDREIGSILVHRHFPSRCNV